MSLYEKYFEEPTHNYILYLISSKLVSPSSFFISYNYLEESRKNRKVIRFLAYEIRDAIITKNFVKLEKLRSELNLVISDIYNRNEHEIHEVYIQKDFINVEPLKELQMFQLKYFNKHYNIVINKLLYDLVKYELYLILSSINDATTITKSVDILNQIRSVTKSKIPVITVVDTIEVVKQVNFVNIDNSCCIIDKNTLNLYLVDKISTYDKILNSLKLNLITTVDSKFIKELDKINDIIVLINKLNIVCIPSILYHTNKFLKQTALNNEFKITTKKLINLVFNTTIFNTKIKEAWINDLLDTQKYRDLYLYTDVPTTSLKLINLPFLDILSDIFRRWYFLPFDGPKDKILLPEDYPYELEPIEGLTEHPIIGKNKGVEHIDFSIYSLANFIEFANQLWNSEKSVYKYMTGVQAITHFTTSLYDWLENQRPDVIYKIPDFYTDVEVINTNEIRQDYWRIYRWIRWYAEYIYVSSINDTELNGNLYIKQIIDDMVRYFNLHYGTIIPGQSVIFDKQKGSRNKFLINKFYR